MNLVGKEKAKLISELVNLIAKSGRIKNKKALLDGLIERENMGSTAIGNGAAIPHAKIDGLSEPILAFARSLEGVDFNSLDGEKTYIFFILISAKEEVGSHLKILAKISHLIKDKFYINLFRKAKSKEEILKLVSAAEKGPKY